MKLRRRLLWPLAFLAGLCGAIILALALADLDLEDLRK